MWLPFSGQQPTVLLSRWVGGVESRAGAGTEAVARGGRQAQNDICHHPLSFIQSQVIDHLHSDTVSGARKSQRPVVGQGPTAIVGVGGN